jgi:sulfur-oxidizing protein SoxY
LDGGERMDAVDVARGTGDVSAPNGRRRALGALAAGACLVWMRPAKATPESLAVELRELFGDRAIRPGRVKLEMPRLAENGNVVPVTVRVDSPMTEQDHVRSIYLFAEQNPLPTILEARLSPRNGRAVVSSRVRVATSQTILAVAELSDGSLWSATTEVEVTVSGCG